MTSNFSFLKNDPKYKEIATACIEAENAIAVSNSVAALQTRRALEVAVKWTYRYDSELTVPYRDNLSSLVHDHRFKEMVDGKLFPRIRFIISLGNKAAHTVKAVGRDQAVEALKNLYDFISWVDFSYSTKIHDEPFNASLLQDGFELEKKNRKIQGELAAREAAWEAERETLEKMLRSALLKNGSSPRQNERRTRPPGILSVRISVNLRPVRSILILPWRWLAGPWVPIAAKRWKLPVCPMIPARGLWIMCSMVITGFRWPWLKQSGPRLIRVRERFRRGFMQTALKRSMGFAR
jgi:hypothetical protein